MRCRLSILEGETRQNSSGHLQEDTQSQVTAIAIAIALTHQGFGAIILAFYKAIRKACGQKIKEGQNFPPPVAEG